MKEAEEIYNNAMYKQDPQTFLEADFLALSDVAMGQVLRRPFIIDHEKRSPRYGLWSSSVCCADPSLLLVARHCVGERQSAGMLHQ